MMKLITTLFLALVLSLSLGAQSKENYKSSDFFKSMQEGDKAAIVMVHFGTTHADTRELTINALNKKIQQEFPNIEVREAYTSRIIIKRLSDRGVIKENPLQVLKKLHNEGYTHVLIQSSTIINGVEMESLIRNVDQVKSLFKDIRVGNSLLYEPEDYESVINILTQGADEQTAYVLVGHGTYDPTTAQYAMMDYMLKIKGFNNFFVGTIEGYPAFDDMLLQVKRSGLKKIELVPFMFVAGEHAKNDISQDWKEDLEKEGFIVDVRMEGLGQNSAIQNLFVSHLKFMTKYRKYDIMDKKDVYRNTGEKI